MASPIVDSVMLGIPEVLSIGDIKFAGNERRDYTFCGNEGRKAPFYRLPKTVFSVNSI